MGQQRPPLFPERTYTFIGADGTVYDRSGAIITPAPGRPVYVRDPDRDPAGHRQDLELAALIRRIRDETGTGGDEAYASAGSSHVQRCPWWAAPWTDSAPDRSKGVGTHSQIIPVSHASDSQANMTGPFPRGTPPSRKKNGDMRISAAAPPPVPTAAANRRSK